jgi:predicted amidophosphoribosyltransferase
MQRLCRQIAACQAPDFLQKDYPITAEIPLYSWGIYDGALKRAIAACKYDQHPEIMDAITERIAFRYCIALLDRNIRRSRFGLERSRIFTIWQ